MVVDSILPYAESGPNDHRKDAPPFSYLVGVKIGWIQTLFLYEVTRPTDFPENRLFYLKTERIITSKFLEKPSVTWPHVFHFPAYFRLPAC